MIEQDRRGALLTLSSLALTACGGGGAAEDTAVAEGLEAAENAVEAFDEADMGRAYALGAASEEPVMLTEEDAVQLEAESTGLSSEQAGVQGTPVSMAGDPPQFRVWDGGSGPSRSHWSKHLGLKWKNENTGDWLDANQTPQGTVPYASLRVYKSGQFVDFDITALVKRWLANGDNRGAMLRAGSGSSVNWSGRLAADPARRPVLVVKTSKGTFNCPVLALAAFSVTSGVGFSTRIYAKSISGSPVIPQFDLKGVTGTVISATMRLFCEKKSSQSLLINVYECDPPRFQLGSGGLPRQMGVAAAYPRDQGLTAHPDVIRAGDFSDLRPGVLFDSYNFNPAYNPHEVKDDPEAPGTKYLRGSFMPSKTEAGLARSSISGRIETMDGDRSDPLRPPKTVTEELFFRMYIYLEADWNSVRDANKMAIGWDLRMGWWNDAQGGYWQCTTGNGGAPGTGLKKFAKNRSLSGAQHGDRWEYQGHSVRMEAGRACTDGNPYTDLRPIQSYCYNLDQRSEYGSMYRLGRGVITKNRWQCIEQQIKINSVVGPFDELGNGTAVADGELRTWLDGVLCSEVTNIRWRRHPEMGVVGPWVNWFYGGKRPTETPMHYRMNHVVLARKYIGPRVA